MFQPRPFKHRNDSETVTSYVAHQAWTTNQNFWVTEAFRRNNNRGKPTNANKKRVHVCIVPRHFSNFESQWWYLLDERELGTYKLDSYKQIKQRYYNRYIVHDWAEKEGGRYFVWYVDKNEEFQLVDR